MATFAEFYRQGGAFMHLVTLLGLAGIVVGVLAIAQRSRSMALACIGVGVGSLFVGAIGTFLGIQAAEHAVETVSAEYKATALSRGMSVAMNTTLWAGIMAVPSLLAGVVALIRGPKRSA
jgi:hypothetical protein